MENRIIERSAYVRSTSAEMLENRQVEFVISSEAVDSYGTVFVQGGGDFKRFEQNGVVFYVHDSSSSDPDDLLGSGKVYREGSQTIGVVTFEPAEINKKADKILRKIQHGTPYMASIGAVVKRAELGVKDQGEDPNVLYFREWELIEFSVVPIGSNPDAHKRNAQTIEELRNEITTDAAANIEVEEVEEITENGTKRSVLEAQVIINKNKSK